MTREEVKANVSMRDVLSRYGIKVTRSMCSCPFHNDSHPSMKIYKDGYNCFTCHANGDIFSFVQEYEGVTFSEAFKMLGGTYEHESDEVKARRESQRMREKKIREAAEKKERQFYQMISDALTIIRKAVEIYEPYSDGWCEAVMYIPYIEMVYEVKYLNGGEVNEIDVIRKCREIRRRFITF